jgi:hypothetical protein
VAARASAVIKTTATENAPSPDRCPLVNPRGVEVLAASPRRIPGTCSAPSARTTRGRGEAGATALASPTHAVDDATTPRRTKTTLAFVKQRERALRCRHAHLGRVGIVCAGAVEVLVSPGQSERGSPS